MRMLRMIRMGIGMKRMMRMELGLVVGTRTMWIHEDDEEGMEMGIRMKKMLGWG